MTGKTPMTKPETRVAPYTNNMCIFSTILFFFNSGRNKNDEEIEAGLNIKSLLLPKISENQLTKDLKGKSFKAGIELL